MWLDIRHEATGGSLMLRVRASLLAGACNRCGVCCLNGDLRCHNLVVHHPLGTPGATSCRAYGERYNGMPIMLVNGDGIVTSLGACGLNSIQEDLAIIKKGIGKGCSLSLR